MNAKRKYRMECDLPECKRKLAINFMVAYVFWIHINDAEQRFDFSLTADYVACSQIQCQHRIRRRFLVNPFCSNRQYYFHHPVGSTQFNKTFYVLTNITI